jgi:hypothetical protein
LKKEETWRREINKYIAAKLGRRSSSFVDWCGVFNLFFVGCWGLYQSELGVIKANTR